MDCSNDREDGQMIQKRQPRPRACCWATAYGQPPRTSEEQRTAGPGTRDMEGWRTPEAERGQPETRRPGLAGWARMEPALAQTEAD